VASRVAGRLTGSRKTAILLAVLGEEVASAIFRHLSERDVQVVTKELAEMGRVPAEVAQEILEEYSQLVLTQDCLAQGGIEFASRLLVKAFGDDNAKSLLQKVIRLQELSAGKLDSLQNADPQQLAKFLEGEHPQTIALVLAHMDGKQASVLLMKLPEQIRAETVKRLAQLRQFSPEMAEKVSVVLNRRLQSLGEQSRKTYAGFKSVADLINRLEVSAAKEILDAIESEDPKLAINIRNLMFTFDDLLSIPDVAIREWLAAMDKKTLALALKGASADLRNHIFRAMSTRAVDMLKEDMEALGAVRAKEVTQAQQEAVAIIRKLEADGKVVLKTEGDDEYIV
jgi:flagellar motor switch protein FliG